MRTVNLGILAHVDAGKTSLTEQILYQAGVIPAIGRVDHGTTHTDTLDLERERGITIQSAVVSFRLGDLKVNLIDTPGHPDFIAEVERALRVLDGVVLVVSAVEGVQAQTRRLAAAIRARHLPLVVFINKIDRRGAREHELLDDIRRKLGLRVVPMTTVTEPGTKHASVRLWGDDVAAAVDLMTDVLTENDDALLDCYLQSGGRIAPDMLRQAFMSQVWQGSVSPVYFGSAMTGAGVNELLAGVARYLPPAPEFGGEPLRGTVFKIQRDRRGERLAYARLFAGHVAGRDRVVVTGKDAEGRPEVSTLRITGIDSFDEGKVLAVERARAGDIVRLHGLKRARIGDAIGGHDSAVAPVTFAPPVLESIVRPVDPTLRTRLNAALAELADADPLIGIRRDTRRGVVSVRLYGEVQKEVVAASLEREFGVRAIFEPSQVICVEKPVGSGAAVERMGDPGNPFAATIGLAVGPGTTGSGITYHRELGSLPLSFYTAIEETVHATLEEGLHGWSVTDCEVTLTEVGFSSPVSTAGDFRNLTPMVLMAAVQRAGTRVHEPIERFTLDVVEERVRDVLNVLGASRASIDWSGPHHDRWRIGGSIPSTEVHRFEQRLPGLSQGSGDFESRFEAFAPVAGVEPTRPRIGLDPLNRKAYLAQVSQR